MSPKRRKGARVSYLPRPREHRRKPDPYPEAIDLDALIELPEAEKERPL